MLDKIDIAAAVARAKTLVAQPQTPAPITNVTFTQLESKVWAVRETPTPKIRRSEADEQADLFRWLRTEGRALGYIAHSVPNDASSDPERLGKLKQTGLTPGAPDLYVFAPGVNLAIEMKKSNGKLSDLAPHQEGFLSVLADLPNWISCVCFGYTAARAAISRWLPRD